MTATKIGFISLGCPKALVDSERILTQLRIEGYEIVPTYEAADLVVVNTCGFIDSARVESLEAIGEAVEKNGKVIVTGCLGVNDAEIRRVHPGILDVTGPQQYEQVIAAVHKHTHEGHPSRRPGCRPDRPQTGRAGTCPATGVKTDARPLFLSEDCRGL